jgi:hypothetical protein
MKGEGAMRIFRALLPLALLFLLGACASAGPPRAAGCTPYYPTGPNTYNRDCYVPSPPPQGYYTPAPTVYANPQPAQTYGWFGYGDPRRHQVCPQADTILEDGRKQTHCYEVYHLQAPDKPSASEPLIWRRKEVESVDELLRLIDQNLEQEDQRPRS